ncbi:hypothetical protein [Bradyrhizobium jicamae]|nr:hypothetical protein [Bradyrhizobium jicamae]
MLKPKTLPEESFRDQIEQMRAELTHSMMQRRRWKDCSAGGSAELAHRKQTLGHVGLQALVAEKEEMIYIYGLLSGLLELQKIMEAEGRYSDIAQQPSLKAIRKSEDNVIYVDFKSVGEAEEGA